ncbi:hypothetical protein MKW92_022456 [Papaver armeniacum]|nr:hypothetical protein MKW92_022456 [Papaver armeniacum]
MELLKLPILSCSTAAAALFLCFKSPATSRLPVTLVKTQMRNHTVRTYAAVSKYGKLQLPKKKKRLDEVCLERFQQYSRTYIQSWIIQGKVIVDGKVVNKAGTQIPEKAVVEINAEIPKYVCRGGHKLEAAIEQLNVDVAGKVALDAGLSTGGFTDCLLQYGASFVYGVDVGYGQVMPAIVKLMKDEATLVTLVKPQFEARRSQVGGGGIVRDPLVHKEVLERITKGVESFGFCSKGWIESPLKGAEGNTEFLVCFHRTTAIEQTAEAEQPSNANLELDPSL